MGEWERLVQEIVEYVDECIKKCNDETVTLSCPLWGAIVWEI